MEDIRNDLIFLFGIIFVGVFILSLLVGCGSDPGKSDGANESTNNVNITIDAANPNSPSDDESLNSILALCCGNPNDDQTDDQCLVGFGIIPGACG